MFMGKHVTIFYDEKEEKIEISKGLTAYDIVSKIGENPDGIIVTRDDVPISIDEEVHAGDVLRLIQVFSGG